MSTREDMLRSVAAVLVIDGAYAPRERRLLEWLRERWGMTADDLQRCLAEARAGEDAVLPTGTPAAKRAWFAALTAAVASDGIVTPQEWTILRVAADRLGMSAREIVTCLETTLRERKPPPTPVVAQAAETTLAAGCWPGPVLVEPELTCGDDEVPLEWKPGDVVLDLYQVREVLGQGGVGTVYRVRHFEWDLDLAVKCPRREFLLVPGAAEHLLHEAETWIQLGLHPNIVACYYVRMLGGMPRVFAEYVDGGSLADWIRDRRLYAGGPREALARILDVAIQFAWGLDHAHGLGLVHGDVKPANVLVTRQGRIKVTDFGLAKAITPGALCAGDDEELNGMTPAYCSPEQAENRILTPASDVWSWAVSVLEMFCGAVTWHRGHQAGDALLRVRERGVLDHEIPELPEALAELLSRCFCFDPTARPRSMGELVEHLRLCYANETGRAWTRPEPRSGIHLADGLVNRAISLRDLDRQDEARVLLDLALDGDPHHIHATYHRGLMLWRGGELRDDELVRQLREVGTSHTRSWEDELLLAWVHLERGDTGAARSLLAVTAELAGDDPQGRHAVEQAGAALASPGVRCLHVLAGHEGAVHALALAADAGVAVSGGWDRAVRVWDVPAGTCRGLLNGHTHYVNAVSVAPDGRWAASAGADGRVCVWDVVTLRALRTMETGDGPLTALAQSTDGRFALVGGVAGTLSWWDLARGQRLRQWDGEGGAVHAIALTGDGRRALVGCEDGTAAVWDVTTGTRQTTLEGHDSAVTTVAWTPDGDLALTGGADRCVAAWRVSTGQRLRSLWGHSARVTAVAVSADGQRALSAGADRVLRVWEVPTGRCLRTLEEHGEAPRSVALAADGRLALSAGDDRAVRVWSLPDETPAAPARIVRPLSPEELEIRHTRFETALAGAREALAQADVARAIDRLQSARAVPGFERAPAALALSEEVGKRSARGPLAGGWCEWTSDEQSADLNAVAVSADGRTVATAGSDGALRLWDPREERLLRLMPGHRASATGVALSADGRLVLSAGLMDAVRVWDAETGHALRDLSEEGDGLAAASVVIAGDGRLAAAIHGTHLTVWRVRDGARLLSLQRTGSLLRCLDWTPDGRIAVTGTLAHEVLVWDLARGVCRAVLHGHARPVSAVAVNIDGRRAVSAGLDGVARIWNLDSGTAQTTLTGHEGAVRAAAISAAGRVVVTGGDDDTVRIWDADDGRCLRVFEGHSGAVVGVALTADGQRAVSIGEDRVLRVWRLDWTLEVRQEVEWDEDARPWVDAFCALHMECDADGLVPTGILRWQERDLRALLTELQEHGFGWISRAGIERQLAGRG